MALTHTTRRIKDNPDSGQEGKQKRRLPWKVFFITVFLLVAMMILSLVTFEIAFGGRVAPGVKVATVDVGGLQKDDAVDNLAAGFNGYLKSQLVLKSDTNEWKLPLSDLNVEYDAGDSFDRAFGLGKDGSTIQKALAYAFIARDGKSVPPTFSLDDNKLKVFVDKIGSDIDKDPVNAGLQFDGLQLKTLPGQNGQKLDRQGTINAIKARVAALSVDPIQLQVASTTPAIVEYGLDSAKAEAQRIIDSPIKLQFEDKNWTIDRPTIASMVTFQEVTDQNGQRQVSLALDEDKLNSYIGKIAKDVDRAARKARFKYDNGKLTNILSSQDGRSVDQNKLSQMIKDSVKKTGDRTINLPVSNIKPTVTDQDISKIVVKDKIEERSTSYAGSIPERAHNVELGASRLNGVVVAPGETFSFNKEVGPVTGESGYQLGFAIIGAETVPDPGGGICQVSTTLFQTAFWTGLPIVERYAHAYRMTRYEPPAGLDATVYDPDLNFRFKNDTDNYILIQSSTDSASQRVTFTFYGVKPNRSVTIDGPHITNVQKADPTVIRRYTSALAKGREVWAESAQDGADISLTRIVQKDGKELSHDTFKSSYRPERNVLLVGTGN